MAFAATIVSMYSILGVFGKLILGWLSDKLGVIKSGNIGYLTIAISFILLLFGENKTLLIIMAIFFSLGNSVASVSLPLFVSHIFGTNNAGVMMGITNSAFQVGMALGGVMTGAVYDITGSYKLAWIGLTIIALISMICITLSYTISRKTYTVDEVSDAAS